MLEKDFKKNVSSHCLAVGIVFTLVSVAVPLATFAETMQDCDELKRGVEIRFDVNGERRLSFPTFDELDTYLGLIADQGFEFLDACEQENGFVSMRGDQQLRQDIAEYIGKIAASRLEAKGNQLDLSTHVVFEELNHALPVEDDLIASVLNPAGEIQVGRKIYKVTRDFVYAVDELDEELIQKTDLVENHGALSGVEVFAVQREVLKWEDNSASSEGFSDLELKASSACTQKHRSKKRLKGKSWIENLGFFASAGTSSKQQKKWLGIWWSDKADWIKIQSNYNVALRDVSNSAVLDQRAGSHNETKNRKRKVSKTFMWYVGEPNIFIDGTIESFHESRKSRRTRNCSTGMVR